MFARQKHWEGVYDIGRDPITGKRRQKWVSARTKAQVEKKLNRALTELEDYGHVEIPRITVKQFLERWLRDYVDGSNIRRVTARRYRGIVESYLIPALGRILLKNLRRAHIQKAYEDDLKHLSATSVLQHHRVLKQALSHAVKWEVLARNPADLVDPPRKNTTEIRSLTPDEVRLFLEAAEASKYYPLFALALHTGMRRSELCGLTWRNVDLRMGRVSVVHILHEVEGGALVREEPKSRWSKRSIKLTPESQQLLKDHLEGQKAQTEVWGYEWSLDWPVFATDNGQNISPVGVSGAFRRIVRKVPALKTTRLHDLRHTHATLLMMQGINPKVVQERLGHSSIAVTMDIYSHVTPDLQDEAAEKFGDALR